MLVVDEAHLYRGAAGAEVGLLLRRLRSRLASPERLQVICTSASFKDDDYAREFAAQLTGRTLAEFRTIQRRARPAASAPIRAARPTLGRWPRLPLDEFYEADEDADRLAAVQAFLTTGT